MEYNYSTGVTRDRRTPTVRTETVRTGTVSRMGVRVVPSTFIKSRNKK